MNGRAVLTVSDVTRTIREILESSFPRIQVRGEVSNLSRPQSGHLYFSLIDDSPPGGASRLSSSQLPCVVWRSSVPRLRARLENGQKVVVTGKITTYEPRGTYQLIGEQVEPAGLGELQRLFEELKERLRKEGLFDAARKRPLPFLPERIGLVTSPSGAAIRDVLRVLYLRHPRAWVRIIPVRVQGEGAAEEIARAVELFNAGGGQAEVIVVTRGGGSLEDLWAFNDEKVARAIAASSIPVISAVGHEVDFSISDFVADARAQTPTQAAELLVPDLRDLVEQLAVLENRVSLAARHAVAAKRSLFERAIRSRAFREPHAAVQELFERVDDLAKELKLHLYNRGREWQDSLAGLAGKLESLSPARVLARGYAHVTDAGGRVVTDSAALQVGQPLKARLSKGVARVEVVELES